MGMDSEQVKPNRLSYEHWDIDRHRVDPVDAVFLALACLMLGVFIGWIGTLHIFPCGF